MKKYSGIIFFLIFLFSGCQLSDKDIKAHSWKLCGEKRIEELGDWFDFKNSNCDLNNDTIFINNIPVVRIIEANKSNLGSGDKIVVESIVTKKVGTYCGK